LNQTKLVDRFESNGFKIITEIMGNFKNPEVRMMFARLLNDFNANINTLDSIFKVILPKDKAFQKELNLMLDENVLNRLYLMMNIIMFEMGYDYKLQGLAYFVRKFCFADHLYYVKDAIHTAVLEASKQTIIRSNITLHY
jgi:hypothetical protein